ncbi:MAG: helix-turn-helix domain-containing protein, partial [Spirochaetales bacterium]|nr:helix-turn-helix domain-containing protein [Spirochaetales bacterium]
LDEPAGSNLLFPFPDSPGEEVPQIIEIPVDPAIAFAMLVRQYRISNRMTQAQMQEALDLPNKTSYTRLERKGNPRLSTISRVLKLYPDFPISDCF